MPTAHDPLRLNVGFIVHAQIGFTRDFEFDIPRFKLPEMELNGLTGVARVTRTPQGLPVTVKMRAAVPAQCVRCLIDFPQILEIEFTELFAFTPRQADESGLILPEDMHIDLEPLVREYMLLEMPISPLCKPDCRGLCPVCGANRNETDCQHQAEDFDPRLSQLKALLDENEEDQPEE